MPSAVATASFLERSLAALGEVNADVAARLREASGQARDHLDFIESQQGALSAVYRGRRLASAHRPLDEAKAVADRIDLVENAVVVSLGFGLGYHLREIALRMRKAGVILVFEPDVALLASVLQEIDHSQWLRDSLVVFVTDADDPAALAHKLKGAESIIAQGVAFAEHAANRARVGEAGTRFTNLFTDFVGNAKTTLLTTLVRSTETARNSLWNIDHYTTCAGVADLKGAASGFPAVVVSAGPSLHRNIDLLAEPGVRERCVIIAVQTTLKPLLAASVRPHFVTALDYHEISGRFYEGLTGKDVEGVTLIAEPKAHPVILDSFPGQIRCVASSFLDQLLGPCAREMGSLPGGATVAHLAFYVAMHLGCDPIAFIGQDLGFTDGLYYAPGTAIHDVWGPELGTFNTIEMMEWQRIVRHRVHLHRMEDHEGKTIYTDAQMLAYLQQFERDFAESEKTGATVIDATEGGVKKRHTQTMSLERALERHATRLLPPLPRTGAGGCDSCVGARLAEVRGQIESLAHLSRDTERHLSKMLESQHDPRLMNDLFARVDRNRAEVEKILDAFELLNQFNQLAVFKRFRADRKLEMSKGLDPLARQRAQIERDLVNVRWTADGSDELASILTEAEEIVDTGRTWVRPDSQPRDDARIRIEIESDALSTRSLRAAALIAVDAERFGHALHGGVGGQSILQRTLERVGGAVHVDHIVILAPQSLALDQSLDLDAIGTRVSIERLPCSPFGPEHRAIRAARAFAPSTWRGALAGMSIWDEVLCPKAMFEAMERRDIDAAVICGPDWPLVDVSRETGIDALVARWREHPDRHNLVFTQSPPGLSACLVSKPLMGELSNRSRLATIGALLGYQPHAPQADPIARDANVQIDHRVRTSFVRAAADREPILRLHELPLTANATPRQVVEAIEQREQNDRPPLQHIILEVNSARSSIGLFASSIRTAIPEPARNMADPAVVRTIAQSITAAPGTCITLAGLGDPLLHPDFDWVIPELKSAGAFIHVRTELRCDHETLDRLLASGADIVSVDLHADRATTYRVMMGDDRFPDVIENLHYLIERRLRLSDHEGAAAWALPWIVPRIQRCRATYEDIDSFFDRWLSVLGTALIDSAPPGVDAGLRATHPPGSVVWRELNRRMFVRCDGSAPVSEVGSSDVAGALPDDDLVSLWTRLSAARHAAKVSGDVRSHLWISLP